MLVAVTRQSLYAILTRSPRRAGLEHESADPHTGARGTSEHRSAYLVVLGHGFQNPRIARQIALGERDDYAPRHRIRNSQAHLGANGQRPMVGAARLQIV
jgi:hypothetical protein